MIPDSINPEEEKLWKMSDDELEKLKDEYVEEPNGSSDENIPDEDSNDMDNDIPDNAVDNDEEDNDAEQSDDEDVQEDSDENDSDSDDDIDEENDTTSDEEQVKDGSDEKEHGEPKVEENKKYKIKADGMDFDFSVEELIALAPKAMNYTKKLQEIAPYRKIVSAIKENNIQQNDINMLIEAKSGNKEAIAEMLKQAGVDSLDIDTTAKNQYVAKDYGKDEKALQLEEVASRISLDPEYTTTVKVVDDMWDSKSRAILKDNPSMIEGLHNDIKDGVYSKIAPEAMKMKALDFGSKADIEYYIEAGRQYFANQNQEQTVAKNNNDIAAKEQARQEKQDSIKNKSATRKAAAVPKSRSGQKTVIDYLDDNDESFDEWYKNLKRP